MSHVVDSHFHIWELSRYKYPWPTPDVEPLYRDFTIDDYNDASSATPVNASVFVQALNNSPEEARWVLSIADRHPNIRGVVAGLDLTDNGLSSVLDELCKDVRFVGVRHVLDLEDPTWLCRDDVHQGLALLQQHGKTFDLLLRPPLLKHVPSVVLKFPRLRFIIDHMAKPYIKDRVIDGWKEEIADIAKYPNVYCKISGLIPEADLENWKQEDFVKYIKHILDVFGEDRCVFGSDWPVMHLSPRGSFKTVFDLTQDLLVTCGVSQEGRNKILGANAVEFYKLQV